MIMESITAQESRAPGNQRTRQKWKKGDELESKQTVHHSLLYTKYTCELLHIQYAFKSYRAVSLIILAHTPIVCMIF